MQGWDGMVHKGIERTDTEKFQEKGETIETPYQSRLSSDLHANIVEFKMRCDRYL